MSVDAKTIRDVFETMSSVDAASTVLLFVVLLVVFVVAQGLAQAFTGWASKKMFKDNDGHKKHSTSKMQKAIAINGNIHSELVELRKETGANVAQIWLYSNGERSFSGICFNYLSVKYEAVEQGYPSFIQTSPKISTTAMHKTSKLMFTSPSEVVKIESVSEYGYPDRAIFDSMHIESAVCAAIQTKKMTVGILLVGWLYKEVENGISDAQCDAVSDARHRISGMLEALEQT